MLLAALVDAGCPLEVAAAAARSCGVAAPLRVEEVQRAGLRGLRLHVGDGAAGRELTLPDLLAAVEGSGLAAPVRAAATAVLRRLGECEARLHGVATAEVHLHELGDDDTLVDVVGVCAALHHLEVTELRCSPLPAAPGSVETAHGVLPLPAPATLALLAEAGAPLLPGVVGVEQVTPTAAALLTTLARFAPPRLRLRRVGHGAGARDLPGRPNLVRCWLGEPFAGGAGGDDESVAGDGWEAATESVVELRVNLDDAAPAVVAGLAARCLEAGALDAWVVAATMKKGRPGHVLHALAAVGAEAAMAGLLLAESPTLGVRMTTARRHLAGRDSVVMESAHGPVRVKRKWLEGRVVDARPELDDVAAAARRGRLPLQRLLDELGAAARAAYLDAPSTRAAPAEPEERR